MTLTSHARQRVVIPSPDSVGTKDLGNRGARILNAADAAVSCELIGVQDDAQVRSIGPVDRVKAVVDMVHEYRHE